jgi:hypothetical protein
MQPCPLRHLHDHQNKSKDTVPSKGAVDTSAAAKARAELRDLLAKKFVEGKKDHVLRIFLAMPPLLAAHMAMLVERRLGQEEYYDTSADTDFWDWLWDHIDEEDVNTSIGLLLREKRRKRRKG